MNELLERESEKLARCWMQHKRPWLRGYLVASVEDPRVNLLSMARMRELFARHGFTAQVLHIGTFLREYVGGGQTHNPNAYTFLLSAL